MDRKALHITMGQTKLCHQLFKKKALAQVFSCEFCEVSKNTFCYRIPPVAASVYCRIKVAAEKLQLKS